MKLINKNITSRNINNIFDVLNDSYNINNIFIKFIDKIFYEKELNGKKVLFLSNDDNKNIGILIYDVHTFKKFNILTIEELCVINEYKSMGLSKLLLEELLKIIKNKYKECYLSSIICDLRSISSIFDKYEIIYPNISFSDDKTNNKKIIYTAYNLLKKWYMKKINDSGIIYIPFYINKESYSFMKSKNVKLNDKQKLLKKTLIKFGYTLGYGIGIFNLIKIT